MPNDQSTDSDNAEVALAAASRHGRNSNIQFLRGMAIILVLFAHASVMLNGREALFWDGVLTKILPGVGVDLFFIISGYLMGVTFLSKNKHFDPYRVYGFYKKRIRRVLLPTWFWAAIALIIGLANHRPHSVSYSYDALLGIASSTVFFLANVYTSLHETDFGYFWSIALEMQFYLFFPLLLLTGRYFWLAAGGIFIWFSFYNPFSPAWLFRVNALFLGLVLWKFSTTDVFRTIEEEINLMSMPTRGLVSLLAIVCASIVASALAELHSFRWSAVALILAVPFTLLSFSREIVFGAFSKPIERVGTISFSLYLCHIPVWLATMGLVKHLSIFMRVPTCVSVAVLAAYVSFRYIEQPLMTSTRSRVSSVGQSEDQVRQ